MTLTSKQKKQAASKFQQHDQDTGSAAYQVALLTAKIKKLVDHLRKNPKDKHSRRGLLGMISQRKKLIKHLKNNRPEAFEKVTKELGLKG